MRFNINGRPLPVIFGCIILLLPQGSCSLFGKESFQPSYESDWPDVSAIVHRYEGVFDTPYKEHGTAMALGPILGNGDMGVYLSGTEDRLDYCMATSSFWGGCLKNIGFGGISISRVFREFSG